MRLTLAVAAAALAVSGVTHAQTLPPQAPLSDALARLIYPPHWADVSGMDLAGVRLGMSPAEVRVALIAKGFTPKAQQSMMKSWSARLADKAADRGKKITDSTEVPQLTAASGPQGDSVEVWYVATPQGARVASVSYTLPLARMAQSDFAKNVQSRYGKPTLSTASKLAYCTSGDGSCGSLGDVYAKANLIADTFVEHTIALKEGTVAEAARNTAFAAALDVLAPKTVRAGF